MENEVNEMQKGDIVVIIYQDRSGKFSKRWIQIISATDNYVMAYCFARRQVRTFSRAQIFSMMRVRTA